MISTSAEIAYDTINNHAVANAMPDEQFLSDVLNGLGVTPKRIPCKYFYDERGSILFTEICRTREYYLTRTELALLNDILPEIASLAGSNVNIIEYGSGEGRKIRDLLSALDHPRSYTPVDISAEILLHSTRQLKREFPDIAIHPVVGDYTAAITLPDMVRKDKQNRRIVFFPGSTISNFSPEEARNFLLKLRMLLRPGDGILLGVDLLKSPNRLHHAYNDREGVTADFNLNLLRRINSELSANFDRALFEHYAFYNPLEKRIEMHLVSLVDQKVTVAGHTFHFARGETIHTENSYKYTISEIVQMCSDSGLLQERVWADAKNLFSMSYFSC